MIKAVIVLLSALVVISLIGICINTMYTINTTSWYSIIR